MRTINPTFLGLKMETVDRVEDGFDLWLYTATYGRCNANLRIVYGCKGTFKTIASRHIIHYDVGLNVGYDTKDNSGFLVVMQRASWIMKDFNRFLDHAIGTHDKESVEYQEFLKIKGEFITWVMKQKVLKSIGG